MQIKYTRISINYHVKTHAINTLLHYHNIDVLSHVTDHSLFQHLSYRQKK